MLFKQLDVLSGRDLPFLDNSLVVLVEPDLMIVVEGVILAHFPYEILDLVTGGSQEILLNLEKFLFNALG